MAQLRPQREQAVRLMVERAIDVPEAEEFGAIDIEFRDAGRDIANEVRQAARRAGKKGYTGCGVTCSECDHAAKFRSYQTRRVLTAPRSIESSLP